jgi:hypothetical protein
MPTLEITTIVSCPLRCTFCPQDKLSANYTSDIRHLTLDNFKLILAKVPKHVRIDFSGMSEPWANRFATDMLEHTLKQGYDVAVYTTLQGMRDPDRVIDVMARYREQVEVVVVHLPDANGNMRGFKDSETYRAALAAFDVIRDTGKLRSLSFMTMEDSGIPLYGIFTPTDLVWSALTRAGNVGDVEGQNIEDSPSHQTPVLCGYTPFYDQNVLLPNGDVVVCCMDYSVKHKIGNLLIDDYSSLFSSHGMNSLRRENMKFSSCDASICRKCSRATPLHIDDRHKQFWHWPKERDN